jgi:hypothetical protein
MYWPGHVECTGEMRNAYKILVIKHEEQRLLDLEVDGRITLNSALKKYSSRVWTGFIWLRIGSVDELFSRWQ